VAAGVPWGVPWGVPASAGVRRCSIATRQSLNDAAGVPLRALALLNRQRC
jgi:hypothetical protein